MKPYSFVEGKAATGCCPGHDWPVTNRWSGKYSSRHSKQLGSKCNRLAKRSRRRFDKQNLAAELDETELSDKICLSSQNNGESNELVDRRSDSGCD